jgi:hypothetical protein
MKRRKKIKAPEGIDVPLESIHAQRGAIRLIT